MTTTTSSSVDRDTSDQRQRTLSMIAGALGILMFLVGFLRWLKIGDGDSRQKYSGFAFAMPTTAVIGLSLAAGLIAILGATERRRGRGVPSAIPTGLAATSFLLAVGVFLGKGAISPQLGSKVGVEIGLILGLLVSLIQTIVLGMGLASRHEQDDHDADGQSTRRF